MSRYLTAANVLKIKLALYGALVVALLWGVVDAMAAPLTQFTPPDFGSNETLAILIIGFVMSPVISFVNRLIPPGEWSSEAKGGLSFVVCAAAAALLLLARSELNPADWFRTFLILFVMAIALYKFYFQPSGISGRISGT